MAQTPAGPVLKKIGEWIVLEGISYVASKGIDKALGLDYEKELREIENGILLQLKKGRDDNQVLRAELAAVRSQQKMLDALLRSKPTSGEVLALKQRVDSDLAKLNEVQKRHEQKLIEHDQRIRTLEGQVQSILGRPEAREILPSSPPLTKEPWSEPAQEESTDRREHKQRPEGRTYEPQLGRRGRGGARVGEGGSFAVSITGSSNEVRIEETESSRSAKVGTFELRESGSRQIFYAFKGEGGVVTFRGSNNTVYVSRQLCNRVRKIDLGSNNRVRCD